MDYKGLEELLAEYGLAIPNYVVVSNVHELENIRLRFPVVLKIVSKTITHKSDVGGVITNIYDKESLIHAADRLMKEFHKRQIEGYIDGFRIEEQITDGLEFLLGSSYDSSFGVVGAFGFGGVAVELYRDVVFFMPEEIKTNKDVKRILQRTKIGEMILKKGGFRGKSVNLDALYKAIFGFSRLLFDHKLANLEINPLICNSENCWACDIRYKEK